MDLEKLKKLRGGASDSVRTGGKGSVRRKKKAAHKAQATDDKRLQSTLKRLGVNAIPGIEEVNIFKGDEVVHFSNPKVQASIQANTYVVSGVNQTKKISDMLPGIISQMGPEGLGHLQKMAAAMGMKMPGAPAAGGDDDDVPEIAGDFEDAAKDDDDDVPELV
uniref:Nascent polypeptide-associated complex subunit beta n=1 Tax=Picocystis salinarum TaxID=88271 RepID=A0A7S3UFT8_9CHLO|mmetsp:Transcript_5059/g.32161  ORF Transcript_5059/g.32161 Transcript_5059/m.32161 type:complete len:163 (+) Transcript_5059:33-521(+)|eukprot:PRCOL_00003131-RA